MASLVKRFSKGTVIVIGAAGAALLILGGFYFGYQRGLATPSEIVVKGVSNIENPSADADFSLFWEAWQKLKELHVDSEKYTSKDFLYGAISGLAGSLGDPHTSFFPPAEAKKFQEDINGNFGGIGAEIGLTDERILSVVAPLKNTPAEAAGIKAGDYILKIGTSTTEGMDVNEAVKLIRGPVGSTVTLNMFRKGWEQPRDIVLTREVITVPTLDLTMKDNGTIADIQLYQFNENAPSEFYQAAFKALNGGAKGIILDLRNNPGGFLEVATDLAGWFLNRGDVIVSERFKRGDDRAYRASGNEALKNLPVVVLINGGSASASEILAGALRDDRGAKLVGERSYGKGTVQEITDLKDGSSLKITVARWVMPNGKILDKVGLEPDFKVTLSDDDIKSKRDTQLEKAVEVLKAQL